MVDMVKGKISREREADTCHPLPPEPRKSALRTVEMDLEEGEEIVRSPHNLFLHSWPSEIRHALPRNFAD